MTCGEPEGVRSAGAQRVRSALRRVVPRGLSVRIRQEGRRLVVSPAVGAVDFGSLRRTHPVSRSHGWERGQPIDRYYIDRFVGANAADVRGHVLDIYDDRYTAMHGGDRVEACDILNLGPGNPRATIVADLGVPGSLPRGRFDCVLLTQTLHLVYDVRTALQNVFDALRPGGVVLASVPVVSQINSDPADLWQDCWRFTAASTRRLFGEVFAPEGLSVEAHGNVLAAIAFLEGLAAHELEPAELDASDPRYEMVVCVRAVKLP